MKTALYIFIALHLLAIIGGIYLLIEGEIGGGIYLVTANIALVVVNITMLKDFSHDRN